MSIVHYRPLSLLNELQNELSAFMGPQVSKGKDVERDVGWNPLVDIKEEPKQFTLFAEVPGVEPKDIHIHFEDGVLTIEGKKEYKTEDKKEGYARTERYFGSFYRSFSLPKVVNGEGIVAKTKDGVLEITIPKRQEATLKKIEVQQG